MTPTKEQQRRLGWAAGGDAPLAVMAAGLLLGLTVLLADWGSIALTANTSRVAAIWLANGIVVATLVRQPTRLWRPLLAAAYAANLTANLLSGDSLFVSMAMSAANTAEALVVAWPLRAFKLDADLRSLRAVLTFIGLALLPAPLLSALIAASTLAPLGSAKFASVFLDWYSADAVGLILVVPIGTLVRWQEFRALFEPRKRTGTLAGLALFAVILVLVAQLPQWPLRYLLVPAVLLFSFSRGYAGAVLGVTLTGAAILGAIVRHGHAMPAANLPLREEVLFLQIFLVVLNTAALTISAQLRQREILEERLHATAQAALAAQDEAIAAKQAADFANRAKSQFLANMSHELRTPLNAILGFSGQMHSNTASRRIDPRYVEYAGDIFQAGTHLLNLINDVLDIAKIEAGRHELTLESFDLREPLHEALAIVHELSRSKKIALTSNLPSHDVAFVADRRAVKQIALNLLSNALKFTPDGGEVSVTLDDTGNGAQLTVTDTGVGIPADFLPRLGNPFEQVRTGSINQGTGLGLALVKALARLHGGTLSIASVENAGTTVTVFLPAAVRARVAAA